MNRARRKVVRPGLPGVRREVPLTPRHSAGLIGAYEREEWGRIGIEAYYPGLQQLGDDPYRDESRHHFILGFLVDRKLGRFRGCGSACDAGRAHSAYVFRV